MAALEDETGPSDVFTGPMATVITRRVKHIFVITASVFANLTWMFVSSETQAVNANGPTYPPLFRMYNIKSFQLTSGSVLVVFYADK
jgi:hypothetical protein